MTITLTKLGHSCFRLDKDGRTLAIDPGGFSEQDAAVGADAVLITHEHPDHLDRKRLAAAIAARPALEVWTNPVVAPTLDGLGVPVHAVGHEDALVAAGFDVQVFGELHGVIHPDVPVARNIGFLVDGAVFHPGDAFTVPGAPVQALLVPVSAPFLKISEAIDYIREVAPDQAFGMHDGMLNDGGLAVLDRVLGGGQVDLGAAYRRLSPGESQEIAT
jgi:L-ascorbate metabolism protein UlaG (beta-lactamase superfamily)